MVSQLYQLCFLSNLSTIVTLNNVAMWEAVPDHISGLNTITTFPYILGVISRSHLSPPHGFLAQCCTACTCQYKGAIWLWLPWGIDIIETFIIDLTRLNAHVSEAWRVAVGHRDQERWSLLFKLLAHGSYFETIVSFLIAHFFQKWYRTDSVPNLIHRVCAPLFRNLGW